MSSRFDHSLPSFHSPIWHFPPTFFSFQMLDAIKKLLILVDRFMVVVGQFKGWLLLKLFYYQILCLLELLEGKQHCNFRLYQFEVRPIKQMHSIFSSINNILKSMSFEGYRDREIRQLQERISRLEHENSALKSHSCFQQPHLPAHVPIDPYANSIYELTAKNEKLQREAETYQRQIKRELTEFIRESNLLKECSFRRKYMSALSYPPPKLSGLRR